MMKKRLCFSMGLLLIIGLLPVLSVAQGVAINANNANADASAMLDVQSSDKGILIPRLTMLQRNAIDAPATSLLIFQTDNTPGYYYNSGTTVSPVWTRLTVGNDLNSLVDGSGVATQVAFWDDANTLSSNANLYWDKTNRRLGVGTSAPTEPLHVTGNARVTGNLLMDNTTTITSGRIGTFADGVVGAPAYSFTSNTNTGMYRSAENQLSFSTNGGERLRITSAGLIQSVTGGTAAAPAYSFTADPDIGLWRAGTNILAFSTAGVERLRIDAAGNVGIGGAPSASALLELNSTSKGMLVSRMTEVQKNAITSPATGLLIYQTNETAGFYYNSGTPTSPVWNWLFSGTIPSVPGNVEHWIRPAAANYIHPEHNSNIRINDASETHGIYYDGSSNQYGIYSQTSSVTSPTSAVVGFSNVSGNATYGYLGYNGTYTAPTNPTTGFGSVDGAAVYGIVDDPNRTAGFFRTTGDASVAANIAYSDVWIPGFFYGDYIDDNYTGRPAIYASMNTYVDYADLQSAVQGRSEYLGGTTSNLGYTVGGQFAAVGNEQKAIGIYVDATTSGTAVSTGAIIYGDQYGSDSWKNNNLMQGTGYGPNDSYYGARGVASVDAPVTANYYNFGVYGLYGDLGTGYGRRSGGVIGRNNYTASGTWGSLGYVNSGSTSYGVYGSTAYATGAGKSSSASSGTGVAGYGDLFGAWFRGDVYGAAVKGERFSLYVDGNQYNNDLIVFLNDDESSDNKIPSYASSSLSADIYAKGYATIEDNYAEVKFDINFSKLIDDEIPVIVTITPVGQRAELYIAKISSDGFVVNNYTENQNVGFNWIAIGTKNNFSEHQNPAEICSDEFNNKLDGFMFNENNTNSNAQSLWWDGNSIRYDENNTPKSLLNIETSPMHKILINTSKKKSTNKGNPVK
ncbi:MAG: hypothetical protein PHE33_02155 [Bacteroidales bacterium]|nr:hypothetical protein [Bacteroidales bacterium]